MLVSAYFCYIRTYAVQNLICCIINLEHNSGLLTTCQHLVATTVDQHRTADLQHIRCASWCIIHIYAIIGIVIIRLALNAATIHTALLVLLHLLLMRFIGCLSYSCTNNCTTGHANQRADITATWTARKASDSRTDD